MLLVQLKSMPKYENNFNEMCLEVIKQEERLDQSLGKVVAVNNITYERKQYNRSGQETDSRVENF